MPEQTTNQNESTPNKPKLCPFTKEDCAKDGCALWANVTINTQREDMCAVNAIIMAIVTAKPQPVMQIPPGGMPGGSPFSRG